MSIDKKINNLKEHLHDINPNNKEIINDECEYLSENYQNLIKSKNFFRLPFKIILTIANNATQFIYYEVKSLQPKINFFEIFPQCSLETLKFLIEKRGFNISQIGK